MAKKIEFWDWNNFFYGLEFMVIFCILAISLLAIIIGSYLILGIAINNPFILIIGVIGFIGIFYLGYYLSSEDSDDEKKNNN